jgi:hypothetical protein
MTLDNYMYKYKSLPFQPIHARKKYVKTQGKEKMPAVRREHGECAQLLPLRRSERTWMGEVLSCLQSHLIFFLEFPV